MKALNGLVKIVPWMAESPASRAGSKQGPFELLVVSLHPLSLVNLWVEKNRNSKLLRKCRCFAQNPQTFVWISPTIRVLKGHYRLRALGTNQLRSPVVVVEN